MAKGSKLNEFEKGQVVTLRDLGYNWSEISRKVGRSRSVCKSYYDNPINYGKNKIGGRKSVLSKRSKQLICRLASNAMTSAARIKENLNLKVSRWTVRRVLNNNPNLIYTKMQKKPLLSKQHKDKRLAWALEKVKFGDNWNNVVFTDEKKFNLDGADGLAHYWHDLRKDKLLFSKRQQGGGSVMIWAGFSSEGKTTIAFCDKRLDSIKYQQILEEHFLPFWLHPDRNVYYFQQDNARIHTSASSQQWFDENAIPVMDWPACSPDLNPMENLWGIITRKVYEAGKHFGSIQDLRSAIIREWEAISDSVLRNLANSMSNRIGQLILRHGKHLDN